MKKKQREDVDKLYDQAQACEYARDWSGAEKLYRKILDKEQNVGVWGILGWVLAQREEFKEGLAAAKKMRNLAIKYRSKPLLAIADTLMGRIHHDANRRVLAERYYREALDAERRSETYVFLGSLLNELGRSIESKMCYQQSLELDPHNPEAHYNLAMWYKVHRDSERTVKHLRSAIDINPNFSAALSQLVVALWQFNTPGIEQARELLEERLAENIDQREHHLLLALTYRLLNRRKEAEQQFRFIIEQLRPEEGTYIAFGHFLSRDLNDALQAEAAFKKALELNPESGAAHYYYGRFLLDDHREEEGRKMLQKAASLGVEKADGVLESMTEIEHHA